MLQEATHLNWRCTKEELVGVAENEMWVVDRATWVLTKYKNMVVVEQTQLDKLPYAKLARA